MSQAASVLLFAPQLLSDAATLIFTVPTDPGVEILDFCVVQFVTNDSISRTVTAYAVPAGSSPLPANCVAYGMPVAITNPPTKLQLPMMGPGDMLYALASVASVVSITQLSGVLKSES